MKDDVKRAFRIGNLLLFVGVLIMAYGLTSAIFDVRRAFRPPDVAQMPAPDLLAPEEFSLPTVAAAEVLPADGNTFLRAAQSAPTPEPGDGYVPFRIVIPSIGLDAPIVAARSQTVAAGGLELQQWEAPDLFAAGWLPTSATLGQKGNTVLDGHHNIEGEVFGRLVELQPGDLIHVYSGDKVFDYAVANRLILKEADEPLEVRLANARWIEPSNDERLTLITCWPHTTNTHRLVIVARPLGVEDAPAASATPPAG